MKYFASKKYKVVCREDCFYVKNIKQENLLEYNSLFGAIVDGCRPCKHCVTKHSVSEIENTVYDLLNPTQPALDVNDLGYKRAYNLLKSYFAAVVSKSMRRKCAYRKLTQADWNFVIKIDDDNYVLCYWNPDSNAGGQIVECHFDNEMAQRILNGEELMGVLAEGNQYLSDIDSIYLFKTSFDILHFIEDYLKRDDGLVCYDVNDFCKKVLSQKSI